MEISQTIVNNLRHDHPPIIHNSHVSKSQRAPPEWGPEPEKITSKDHPLRESCQDLRCCTTVEHL
ncbi:hypothetical protein BDV41DRAFT_536250 [Aspergillus transmontanensis]|uniref:Uncharacterized protein n=1 Tax=Aspergillus transmontanensis TaxID=1034304 RepID=A0A5N6VYB6_9EURO|nr:hypothetical protein BDV41DRAFT_536250 [Aspergillus transmontanensis]